MNIIIVLMLTLLLAACNPIPPLEPRQSTECADNLAACGPDCVEFDAINDLPGHIDIIQTRSNRVGETVHATFHLREIPETVTFNRDGVENTVLEYMWTVSIDVDGDYVAIPENSYDFLMMAFTVSSVASEAGRNQDRPLENVIQTVLFELVPGESADQFSWQEVEGSTPRVTVSREDHTIRLSSEIPGVSQDSMLHFQSFDALLGVDCVSPQ